MDTVERVLLDLNFITATVLDRYPVFAEVPQNMINITTIHSPSLDCDSIQLGCQIDMVYSGNR